MADRDGDARGRLLGRRLDVPDRQERARPHARRGDRDQHRNAGRRAGSSTTCCAARSARDRRCCGPPSRRFCCSPTGRLFHVFGGRAAYIHVGAIVGTIMVANVLFVIIPGQKKMLAQIRAGQEPDPRPGALGKIRSVHNTYLTLPVLFIMISNHYPMTYAASNGWLVLALIGAAGVAVRRFFVLSHKQRYVVGPAGCGGAAARSRGARRVAAAGAHGRRRGIRAGPLRPGSAGRRAALRGLPRGETDATRILARRPRACCSTRRSTSQRTRGGSTTRRSRRTRCRSAT